MSLVSAIQFNPTTTFTCDATPPIFPECADGATSFSGTAELDMVGNPNVWGLNMGVLLGLLVVFRVTAYYALKYIG